MTRRSATDDAINTPTQNRRKATQRERLLRGMIVAANRGGYSGANVSAVIGEAGVSRPTFYDYFEDRDECFVATVSEVHERLAREISDAVERQPAQQALAAAVGATVQFAVSEPTAARFVMNESLAGGPRALAARDRGLAQTARLIEAAQKKARPDAMIPDVPVAAVLGAVQRLLGSRLRRGERSLSGLEQELAQWLASYGQAGAKPRWRTLKALGAPPRSPHLPASVLRPPPGLGPGRPRLTEEEVAENHRLRIMFATAQVIQARGYSDATIAEITRLAGVDGRAYYRLFADKQEAFSAIHELGFQYLMAATAGAFFAGASWPERIWEAFRAATQNVDDTPAFAHVAFVEAYAVGARGIQRVEDSHIAFAIFLQEGYSHQPEGQQPPTAVSLEAIITTVFEIVYLQARASVKPKTAGLLAHIVHMCLAPFIGAQGTNRFIDGELAEIRKGPRSGSPKPGRGRAQRAAKAPKARRRKTR